MIPIADAMPIDMLPYANASPLPRYTLPVKCRAALGEAIIFVEVLLEFTMEIHLNFVHDSSPPFI
jgi:hypothetical protein